MSPELRLAQPTEETYTPLVQIGLRQFENDVVKWFKTVAAGNGYSRYGLAKELYTRADRCSSGKYCLTQAYLALPKMASELGISLLPVRGEGRLRSRCRRMSKRFVWTPN